MVRGVDMGLPDIAIPHSEDYEDNREEYGEKIDRCIICGEPVVLEDSYAVAVDVDKDMIVDSECTRKGISCGYIGEDCWEENPQLHGYAVRP